MQISAYNIFTSSSRNFCWHKWIRCFRTFIKWREFLTRKPNAKTMLKKKNWSAEVFFFLEKNNYTEKHTNRVANVSDFLVILIRDYLRHLNSISWKTKKKKFEMWNFFGWVSVSSKVIQWWVGRIDVTARICFFDFHYFFGKHSLKFLKPNFHMIFHSCIIGKNVCYTKSLAPLRPSLFLTLLPLPLDPATLSSGKGLQGKRPILPYWS